MTLEYSVQEYLSNIDDVEILSGHFREVPDKPGRETPEWLSLYREATHRSFYTEFTQRRGVVTDDFMRKYINVMKVIAEIYDIFHEGEAEPTWRVQCALRHWLFSHVSAYIGKRAWTLSSENRSPQKDTKQLRVEAFLVGHERAELLLNKSGKAIADHYHNATGENVSAPLARQAREAAKRKMKK